MLLHTFSRNACISRDLIARDTLQNPKIQKKKERKKNGGRIWKIPILNNSARRGGSRVARGTEGGGDTKEKLLSSFNPSPIPSPLLTL